MLWALFHSDRHAQRLLSSIVRNEIQLVISEAIAVEYSDIIMLHAAKDGLTFEQTKRAHRKFIKLLLNGKLVYPQSKLTVSTDPEDNKFFECTHEAGRLLPQRGLRAILLFQRPVCRSRADFPVTAGIPDPVTYKVYSNLQDPQCSGEGHMQY